MELQHRRRTLGAWISAFPLPPSSSRAFCQSAIVCKSRIYRGRLVSRKNARSALDDAVVMLMTTKELIIPLGNGLSFPLFFFFSPFYATPDRECCVSRRDRSRSVRADRPAEIAL